MLDRLDDSAQTVAAVGGEMLSDADLAEKSGVMPEDLLWTDLAIETAKQAGDAFHDRRIGLRAEVAEPVPVFRHDPELRQASFDLETVDAKCFRKHFRLFPECNNMAETFVSVGNEQELFNQGRFSFQQSHLPEIVGDMCKKVKRRPANSPPA